MRSAFPIGTECPWPTPTRPGNDCRTWDPDLVEARQDIARVLLLPVEGDHLVEDAMEGAFHGGTVVANLPKDQRVVRLANCVESIENTPDKKVGLRRVSGKGLHQPRGDALLIRGEGIPSRYL